MINSTDPRLLTFIRSGMSKDIAYIDDPTYLGFTLLFDFEDSISTRYSFENCSPLFSEDPNRNSAINYLKNIGETGRAILMKSFKEKLIKLNREFPYYFQKVSGIGDINSFVKHNATDAKITIETLDSMDFRVTSMIDDYINAVFDFTNRRQVVPDNLLRFKFCIQISEIRNIKIYSADTKTFENLNTKESYNDEVGNKLNMIILEYDYSLFDFNESTSFSEILNTAPDAHSNIFSIYPGRLTTSRKLNFANFLNQVVIDSIKGSDFNSNSEYSTTALSKPKEVNTSLLSRTQDRINSDINGYIATALLKKPTGNLTLESLAERGINDVLNQIKYKINNLLLGNIYTNTNTNDLYSQIKDFVEAKIKKQNKNVIDPMTLPNLDLTKVSDIGNIDKTKKSDNSIQQNSIEVGNQSSNKINRTLLQSDISDNSINSKIIEDAEKSDNKIPNKILEETESDNSIGSKFIEKSDSSENKIPLKIESISKSDNNIGSRFIEKSELSEDQISDKVLKETQSDNSIGSKFIENANISNSKIAEKIERQEPSNSEISNKIIEKSENSESGISNRIIIDESITNNSIDQKFIERSKNSDSNIGVQNILSNEPSAKNLTDTDLGFFNFAVSSDSIIPNKKIEEAQISKNDIPNTIIGEMEQSKNSEPAQTNILSNDNLLKLYINNIGNIEQSPIEEIIKRVTLGSLGNARERNERDNKDNKPQNQA